MSILTVTHNGTSIIDITSAITSQNKILTTAGKYADQDIYVNFTGDSKLIASNIRYGANIFGVAGTVRQFRSTNFKSWISGSATFSPGFTTQFFSALQDGQPAVSSVGGNWFTCQRNFSTCTWGSEVVGGTSVTIPVPVAATYNVDINGYA